MSTCTGFDDIEKAAEFARRCSLGGTAQHVHYVVDKECNIKGYSVSDFYEYDFYADISYLRGNRCRYNIPG